MSEGVNQKLGKQEAIGLGMVALGALVAISVGVHGAGGFLLFSILIYWGLVNAIRGSSKKKGKKSGFVITFLGSFIAWAVALILAATLGPGDSSDHPTPPQVAAAVVQPQPAVAPTVQPAVAAAPKPAPAPVPQPAPTAALPDSEAKFCSIIDQFANDYASASSDGATELKLSKLRGERGRALAKAMASARVAKWRGTVSQIETNSDGKAILRVQLPCKGTVGTWNNGVSDIMSNTLIPQSSPVYDQATDLKEGSPIEFSGVFLRADDEKPDHFMETSMREEGSMTEPDWIFRFSQVSTK